MSTLKQLQGEIARRMRRGDSFVAIEEQVIEPSALPDAEKAALWLYGWSFVDWRAQRREALAHIERLEQPAGLQRDEPLRVRTASLMPQVRQAAR